MATYTIRLEEALELVGGEYEIRDDSHCYITKGAKLLGFGNYPIHDDNYRDFLTGKIFDHYRMHEIGFETVSMFAYHMRKHLNEVMPIFKKLYEAEKLDVNPLSTVDIRTTTATKASTDSEREATGSADSTGDSKGRAVQSAYPQSEYLDSGHYATSAADETTETSSASNTSEVGEESTKAESDTETVMSGYQGHAAELLATYRDTVVDVDMMVIESCSTLFMGLWGSSQPFDSSYLLRRI